MVQTVRRVLKASWDVEVDRDCITKKVRICTGSCCNSVTKVVGVVMVLGSEELVGTAFAEPAALTSEWSLKLDAPLTTPHRANRDYLPAILTDVLKNTANESTSWCRQILSAAAWHQVVLLSNYRRATAMCALHGAIHKAYCGNPHSVQATVKVQHHVSYHMPARRCIVIAVIRRWLNKHAFYASDAHCSWGLPDSLTVEAINGAWCWDAENLD